MDSLVREGRSPGARFTRRATGSLLATVLGLLLLATGCSSSAQPAARPSSSPAAKESATRWWSNSAAVVGSTIDPAHPVTARLRSSRTQYCTMIAQTVAAGHSVLPGASDSTRLVATTAFLAELTAVAPPTLVPSWRTLGHTLLALTAAHGNAAKVRGVDVGAVRRAVATVAADAKSVCGVDLAR